MNVTDQRCKSLSLVEKHNRWICDSKVRPLQYCVQKPWSTRRFVFRSLFYRTFMVYFYLSLLFLFFRKIVCCNIIRRWFKCDWKKEWGQKRLQCVDVYMEREWTNCFHRTHSVRLLIDSSLSTSLFNRGKGSFLMARLSTNWVSALLSSHCW